MREIWYKLCKQIDSLRREISQAGKQRVWSLRIIIHLTNNKQQEAEVRVVRDMVGDSGGEKFWRY